MDVQGLTPQIDEIRTLMEQRLRVRGRSLEAQLRKAGRRLPRHIRREARFLVQAAPMAANPRLARMIDQNRATRAHQQVVAHLKSIDPKQAARTRLLNLAGVVAFNLFLLFAIIVTFLVWRGIV